MKWLAVPTWVLTRVVAQYPWLAGHLEGTSSCLGDSVRVGLHLSCGGKKKMHREEALGCLP